MQKHLGEAGRGGLEADLRDFAGVFPPEKIDQMILVEAVLQDGFLLNTPFEVTAGGPIGDVAFGEGVTGFLPSATIVGSRYGRRALRIVVVSSSREVAMEIVGGPVEAEEICGGDAGAAGAEASPDPAAEPTARMKGLSPIIVTFLNSPPSKPT